MTIYNILFPFLILIVLGIAIYVLTKHIPEAVERHEIPEKEEKKRWWQIFLGKGENLLRIFRVLLLKLDNKLNNSIKKVREKKEKMGEGLREYRSRQRQKTEKEKSFPTEESINYNDSIDQDAENADSADKFKKDRQEAPGENKLFHKNTGKPSKAETERTEPNNVSKRPISIFHPFRRELASKGKSKAVEEIIKKTFTPAEIKVEKEQYWKKKEAMLIQSVIHDSKNIGLYLQLGRLYSNQHNWKDARHAFLEVLKLDKTNVKAKEELKRIGKYLNE